MIIIVDSSFNNPNNFKKLQSEIRAPLYDIAQVHNSILFLT